MTFEEIINLIAPYEDLIFKCLYAIQLFILTIAVISKRKNK